MRHARGGPAPALEPRDATDVLCPGALAVPGRELPGALQPARLTMKAAAMETSIALR